jgi:tRNA-binding EMAP/Myf-like protein
VIVTNLEPRKIRGQWSMGMLLCAMSDDSCRLITVDEPVEPGSEIS